MKVKQKAKVKLSLKKEQARYSRSFQIASKSLKENTVQTDTLNCSVLQYSYSPVFLFEASNIPFPGCHRNYRANKWF